MRDPEQDLRELGLEVRRRDRGANGPEARLDCPLCPPAPEGTRVASPTFAVNLTSGAWQCHRCKERGNMFTLRQRLRGDTGSSVIRAATPKTEQPPPKIIPESEVARMESDLWAPKGAEVLAYLRGRKLTDEAIKGYRLGFRSRGPGACVALPYFQGGLCVGIKYRILPPHDVPSKFAREAGCVVALYGMDSLKGETACVIVVEGELDAVAMTSYGFGPVVSLPDGATATLKDDARIALLPFSDVLICTDQDEKGDEGAAKLVSALGSFRCRRVKLPKKDANDCLMAGVPRETISEALQSAASCGSSKVKHISEWRDELRNMNAVQLRGITTGWDGLDRLIGGFRDGEVTLLTAATGSGKTSWTIDLARRQGLAGQPCLVASLEMRSKAVAAKLLSVVAGRRWDNMSPTEREPALEQLCNMPVYMLDRYGALPIADFRAEVEFAVRRYGVRVVILDHLHFALGVRRTGSDERELIDAAAFEVQQIALNLNVHVVLVMHPAKLKPDETGRTREPEIGDLKGSSGPSQLADNVCRIARHDGGAAALKFLKVRSEMAALGTVMFKFDPFTLRFEEVQAAPEPVAKPAAKWGGPRYDN